VMRLTDLFLAFPALILAAAVAGAIGASLVNTMLALSTVFWPWYARLVRGQVLSLREREFILAARLSGAGTLAITRRHMLRNVAPIVVIQATIDVGYAILLTSSLSFLGLGVRPPTAEWGAMMADAIVHGTRARHHGLWLQPAWRRASRLARPASSHEDGTMSIELERDRSNGIWPSRRELSLIAVQARTVPGDPRATQDAYVEEVTRLHGMFPRVQLFLHPESHLGGLVPFGAPHVFAPGVRFDVPIPGPLTERLCDLARTLGVWLVPGTLYERGDDGRFYNTAIAISPAGEIVAKYRKIFPWRPWEKSAPGNEFTVFDIPNVGRIGLMICYDGWFPEVPRNLAWMGAEVILHPSATTTVDRPQELILARASAIVNQLYLVNVNASGRPGMGLTIAADPEGRVLYQAGENDEIIPLTFNLDVVSQVREVGSVGLGTNPISQFEEEARGLYLPMYQGGARGEAAVREPATVKGGG
jgi:formamidase